MANHRGQKHWLSLQDNWQPNLNVCICSPLSRVCQRHSMDLFWHAYWPSYRACRSVAVECSPSVASDVDRQLTLWEFVAVGWCYWGWLEEPEDNGSPMHKRGDMSSSHGHSRAKLAAPVTALPRICLSSFNRRNKGENTTHACSISAKIHTHIMSTLSDVQMSMKCQLYNHTPYHTNSGDASALPWSHTHQKRDNTHSSSRQIPAVGQTAYNASSGEQRREVVVVVQAVKTENFVSYSHLLSTLKSQDSGYKTSQLTVSMLQHIFI